MYLQIETYTEIQCLSKKAECITMPTYRADSFHLILSDILTFLTYVLVVPVVHMQLLCALNSASPNPSAVDTSCWTGWSNQEMPDSQGVNAYHFQ